MEYSKLLDLATDLGYSLAMSGAETFRVEESITRVLAAYEIEAEVFVIPNCLHISIEPVIGRPLNRMRRIGIHGNDLDAVEQLSNVSRRLCAEHPAPEIAAQWLEDAKKQIRHYPFPVYLLGNVLASFGFALLFGGSPLDGLLAGICGLVVGLINRWMGNLGANQFFRTIVAAFPMALLAYIFGALIPSVHADIVIIGTLMLLVPGLLFTNAMRDIIHGDTNSGTNRIVQVLLIAAAIALGAATAWNAVAAIWGDPSGSVPLSHGLWIQCLSSALGSLGFAILFNIHGPGVLLCALGGMLSWAVYALTGQLGAGDILAYFWAAVFASAFSEVLARIRKYPAISYLVVSVIPLIPGAGVYYAMEHAVRGQMADFANTGMHTAAVASVMAVGILLVSTSFRLFNTWKHRKKA